MKNNTGDCNTGYYNSGDRNSGNRNIGSYNAGDYNSGSFNAGYYNSGKLNSGSFNVGDCNSGSYNSGNYNAGSYNSGYCNSGNYNSGNCNTGHFNSNSPKVRMFNRDTNLDLDSDILKKLRNLIFDNLKSVCTWVYEFKMTNKEKEQNPFYETTGGYLKKRDYKYCWKKFWEKINQEEKDFIKSLPNFDAEIFKEITGIDVKDKKK
jgi:hypothetical protein